MGWQFPRGSTGLGVATGHVSLQTGFYEAINQSQSNLGAATLAGKTKLAATGFHQDLLDTFTLFGNPALTMDFSVTSYSHQIYLPIVQRQQLSFGKNYRNLGSIDYSLKAGLQVQMRRSAFKAAP